MLLSLFSYYRGDRIVISDVYYVVGRGITAEHTQCTILLL